MYVIREVLHCKPGKVRQMVEKFRAISNALEEMRASTASSPYGCHRRALLDDCRRGGGRADR